MIVYTVRSGDSVYRIARSHSVPPNAVVMANGLQAPDQLVVGQSLLIPTTLRDYGVLAGDSLFRIAQRFGVTIQSLLEANPQLGKGNLIRVGQRIHLPRIHFGNFVVNGYCYPTIRDDVLTEDLRHLSMLSVFSCTVDAQGNLTPMTNDSRIIEQAKAAGVRPHLVLANLGPNGFSPEIARSVLGSARLQDAVIQSVVALMKQKGYRGLDVDFENVPRDARENLTMFLSKARAAMQKERWLLTSAVPPLTRDNQTGILYEGFDFAAEGRYNDYVTLMTYEYGYQGGPPMAVAPIGEVRKALTYAISRMPREKILMGIPNYGYDWKIPYRAGTGATVVTNTGAVAIAAREGAAIRWDETAQVPWFRYQEASGQEHEVWFEDARSIQAKLELAHEFGIAGVSYWTVNSLFAQNWTLLEDLFRVKSLR
ncbi:MAG: LysM peptidoglycan-binding domain-containing protein [Oscillospiraceae bacterium]|jgi:spore germination protein|nr:LysM peptidoglycan-binding domain-containing protein [Oscillospiraceae bacterium]